MAHEKNKINLYYYGDVGAFDLNSPAYVTNQRNAREILYAIASNPAYSYNANDLSDALEIDVFDLLPVVEDLLRIKLISEVEGFFKLEFSCFLDSDLSLIQNKLSHPAFLMASKIETEVENLKPLLSSLKDYSNHSVERWLYHIICDSIFDGSAFDYLENKGFFSTKKPQMDQRDYIVYGFQESEAMDQLSKKLLCSSNNFKLDGYTFNSFGDSDGNRVDFFRINKQLASNRINEIVNERVRDLYRCFSDKHNKDIALICAKLLEQIINEHTVSVSNFSKTEMAYIALLTELCYTQITDQYVKCVVPVFEAEDLDVIQRFSNSIMELIYPEVVTCLNQIINEHLDLSPVRHSISKSEILIELWHQLFGQMNEALINLKIVSNPYYRTGEGRYFNSFYKHSF